MSKFCLHHKLLHRVTFNHRELFSSILRNLECTHFLHMLAFLFIPGLNLQSQFNLENITVFNKNEQESSLGQKVSQVQFI